MVFFINNNNNELPVPVTSEPKGYAVRMGLRFARPTKVSPVALRGPDLT